MLTVNLCLEKNAQPWESSRMAFIISHKYRDSSESGKKNHFLRIANSWMAFPPRNVFAHPHEVALIGHE